jgi:hypothetical protein
MCYDGSWDSGVPHGFGVAFYGNNFVYNVSRDRRPFDEPMAVYVGDWRDGWWHGAGSVTTEAGGHCEGRFERGDIDGWTTRYAPWSDDSWCRPIVSSIYLSGPEGPHGRVVYEDGTAIATEPPALDLLGRERERGARDDRRVWRGTLCAPGARPVRGWWTNGVCPAGVAYDPHATPPVFVRFAHMARWVHQADGETDPLGRRWCNLPDEMPSRGPSIECALFPNGDAWIVLVVNARPLTVAYYVSHSCTDARFAGRLFEADAWDSIEVGHGREPSQECRKYWHAEWIPWPRARACARKDHDLFLAYIESGLGPWSQRALEALAQHRASCGAWRTTPCL